MYAIQLDVTLCFCLSGSSSVWIVDDALSVNSDIKNLKLVQFCSKIIESEVKGCKC